LDGDIELDAQISTKPVTIIDKWWLLIVVLSLGSMSAKQTFTIMVTFPRGGSR
jgi:hypothetical protein